MQIQYFRTAWNDIKNSENWFGKLCLLALVGFIPIFGQMVTYGYLYGWAREIAWGVHAPLPAKIFGNEDGKLYRRGWFIFVLLLVLSLVPSIVMSMGSTAWQSVSYSSYLGDVADNLGMSVGIGMLVYLVGLVLMVLAQVFGWIGTMRIAIYDRLSPGFQFGKTWNMLRHDTNGILRIFGMNLIVSLIMGIVLSIIFSILVVIVVLVGVGSLASSGYSVESLQHLSDSQAVAFLLQFMTSAGLVGFLCLLVGAYAASLVGAFIEALVARAMGYWTLQFDVPHWRGQDDPMPFEAIQAPPAS